MAVEMRRTDRPNRRHAWRAVRLAAWLAVGAMLPSCETAPTSPTAVSVDRVDEILAEGRLEDAWSLVEARRGDDPGVGWYAQAADVRIAQRRYLEALALLDESDERYGVAAETRHRRIQALRESGRWGEARVHLEAALAEAPGDPTLHYLHGEAAARRADHDAARVSLQEARRLAPSWWEPEVALAVLSVRDDDLDDAATRLDACLTRHPEVVEVHVQRALVAEAQADVPLALQHYDRALVLDPSHTESHRNRALLLHAEGRLDAALAALQRALDTTPSNALALRRLLRDRLAAWQSERTPTDGV